MNETTLVELAQDIERQDAALAEIEGALRSLGDVELSVSKAFLEELDELTTPRPPTPAVLTFSLRV